MHDPTMNSDGLSFDFGLTGPGGSFHGDWVLFAADQGDHIAQWYGPADADDETTDPCVHPASCGFRSTRAAGVARGCTPEGLRVPEGSSGCVPLHRDVESPVYALVEFRKLEVDHDNDVDPEELEHGIGRPPPGATAPAIRGSRHVSSLSVRVKRGCGPNSSGRNSHGNVPPPSRRISRCVFVPP
ncbi:hypothetical protein [Streptomyces sp. 1268]|uniref:hypothetical protein n=1 Tax=Streptomyces sp. 1268 TaxID=3231942 RepID=UPI0038D43E1C